MTDETAVNTAENTPKRTNGKPFVRGDPRINRKGRPHNFTQLRKLAVLVAGEQDEEGITRVLEILRDMAKSREVAKQAKFLEYSFGKVPDQMDITSAGDAITFVIKRDDEEDDKPVPPAA
jgi:hypothetical protein